MAEDLRITAAAADAAMNAITALINVGGAGTVEIYDGTRPAGPGTAVGAQVLLAVLTFSATSFGASSGGVVTANTITGDSSANASGTASWFRCKSGGGTAVIDGTVGTSASNMILETTAITATQPINISSFTLTHPLTP